jgi:hypothetical protein
MHTPDSAGPVPAIEILNCCLAISANFTFFGNNILDKIDYSA